MNTTLRASLVLLLALLFAAGPVLVPGFGGFDPARFPHPDPAPPMQPAGWAFAIWGPIYLWLVAMAAFGLWRRRADPGWDATRGPLILSLALGALWLPVARAAPVVATGMIWLMLATALVALGRTPRRDRWLLRGPVGLYAGWLTAAAAVSLGVVAAGHRVAGLGGEAWGVATVLVATLVAVPVILARPTLAYVAALVWGLAGIALGTDVTLVGGYAAIGAAAAALLLATQHRRLLAPTAPPGRKGP